jgi:hypothetical protein
MAVIGARYRAGYHAFAITASSATDARRVDPASLADKFRAAKPVPFTADIVKESNIELMLIEDVRLQEVAGKPERFAYVLALREFIKPVEPAEASLLDTDILGDAGSLLDDLVKGLDLAPNFATGLEQFVEPLGNLLARLQQFNSDNSR